MGAILLAFLAICIGCAAVLAVATVLGRELVAPVSSAAVHAARMARAAMPHPAPVVRVAPTPRHPPRVVRQGFAAHWRAPFLPRRQRDRRTVV